jgi:hypothetical protein
VERAYQVRVSEPMVETLIDLSYLVLMLCCESEVPHLDVGRHKVLEDRQKLG